MENYNLPLNFLLNNKYRIEKVLGQGGFGITYLAEDTVLDTKVCIKELFVSGSSTRGSNMTVMTHNMKDFSFADFKERFIQEAKQLAKFKHPNIVRVQDFFEANNTAYVVMEYIEGQTLKDKVAFGGPLSADASQKIIESILDAVEVVHKAGMLHRDIKPDNLIIGNDGRVVLIDFGSARAYSDEKTIAQTAMVSPGYAPLEQYNPTDRKGTFTDIYSIGATFYFMLTGEKPLNVTNRYSERLKAPHEINPNVSMQVSSAVMLAMEMKAEDRFQNVGDFRMALKQIGGGQKTIIALQKEDVKKESFESVQNNETGKKKNNVLIFSLVGVIAIGLLLLFAFNPFGTGTVNTAPIAGESPLESPAENETDTSGPQPKSLKKEAIDNQSIVNDGEQEKQENESDDALTLALDKIARSLNSAYYLPVTNSSFNYGFSEGWILNKFEYVNSIMSYGQFQSKTDIPIYLSGPHRGSLNLKSRNSFGYYNPLFVKQLKRSISKLLSDDNFIRQTRPTLKKYSIISFLKKIRSIYSLTQSNPNEFNRLKSVYLDGIRNGNLEEYAFRGLVPEALQSDAYWNWSESTYNFWIRRDIDNTKDLWAAIITEVVNAYETK